MLHRVPAAQRHFRDFGWLQTYWLFSFDDYHDPQNERFSSLRVFNDDIIAPRAGFPLHGHKEMEIVTVILDGELTHEDSLGNRASIRTGDIQRMSAGRGIRHSEFNHGDRPVHLYQLWLEPRVKNVEPAFAEFNFSEERPGDGFLALVSGSPEISAPLSMNADGIIYRLFLKGGETSTFHSAGRSIFIYLSAGELNVNGEHLLPGDQLRVINEELLHLESRQSSAGLLLSLP
jgi:redox-sensitive bicupin YhaK (pirin superfamily)